MRTCIMRKKNKIMRKECSAEITGVVSAVDKKKKFLGGISGIGGLLCGAEIR